MTVKQSFEKFILSRRLADLSDKTIKNYTDFVNPFVEFLGNERKIITLCDDDVNDYIETLLDRRLSKASRATYIRHIKIYLRWLEDNYNVDVGAKQIRVPKTPKKVVKIYSDDEVMKIFSAVDFDVEWIALRNKCIIALMYDSGLRRAEVCELKHENVSFVERRLVVRGKGDKERTVPLGDLTAHFMKAYIDKCPYTSKKVFVNKLGQDLTYNAVKLMIQKVAEKLDFTFSSHRLRHNFATNYCLDQYEKYGRIDVFRLMILMGHEDIETTNRYLHIANEIIATKESISHLDKLNFIIKS